MTTTDRVNLPEAVSDPVDKLVIRLRAHVVLPKPKNLRRKGKDPVLPSEWALIFDTETTTDPSQRLRFGTYQLRARGHLVEKGAFYNEDEDVFPASDLLVLQQTMAREEISDAGEQLHCRTRTEFVETFFKWAEADAMIIGFNLPFDLSRLALSADPARRRMKGGFSFDFTGSKEKPRVRVKHLSRRSQFIDFAGSEKTSGRKTGKGEQIPVPRGFFVDVKTLAAALTSEGHSLESLSKLLKLTLPKSANDEHGKPLTPDYVRYALHDTQVTWQCFEALAQKYKSYGLRETGLYDLFSEASLGKAFLKAMNIKPWQEVQPEFSTTRLGHIMSSYFGGRAEVHIRRTIVPVIHCDFLSMYPTVCTLMGLWRFVIAQGMTEHDDTEAVRRFVETCKLDDLQDPALWPRLTVLVKVQPEDDIFPVRARYEDEPDPPLSDDGEPVAATIGLNRLTSSQPLWFTLTDVLASKLLRGKTPKILEAIRFNPIPPQDGLQAIQLGSQLIDPVHGDFYRDIINRRRTVKTKMSAASGDEKAALQSEQQALKILANATSYGIFVELNVEELDEKVKLTCHGATDRSHRFSTNKVEKPGQYFHPLLGTLITGAARLMLALAEKQVLDEGLDWAFCDTDSLAIANVAGVDNQTFIAKVEKVRAWFEPLNPYDEKGSILQLEKTNFPKDSKPELSKLSPPECLAISAKRYVLFNRNQEGQPIVRKASAHGLGQLLAPYGEPNEERRKRIERIGVELWQEDYWKTIIKSADSANPDVVDTSGLEGFDQPAASRYSATKPSLLKWFKVYNEGVPPSRQIGPFNFLLVLQAKSKVQMANVDPVALSTPTWNRRHPRPAAPYFKTAALAAPFAFDRDDKNGAKVPIPWLKTLGRSLSKYHLHPETKFKGGGFEERGILRRRHVSPLAIQAIGKEADNLEEREAIGEGDDAPEYHLSAQDRARLIKTIRAAQKLVGVRELTRIGQISHHTLGAIVEGQSSNYLTLTRLAEQAARVIADHEFKSKEVKELIEFLRQRVAKFSRATVARELNMNASFLGRILAGDASLSAELATMVKVLKG